MLQVRILCKYALIDGLTFYAKIYVSCTKYADEREEITNADSDKFNLIFNEVESLHQLGNFLISHIIVALFIFFHMCIFNFVCARMLNY